MSADEDFATIVRAALGHDTAPAAGQVDLGPRLPAPNGAQGTSQGSAPRLNSADLFVDFLAAQLSSFDHNTTRGADAATVGQHVGWRQA